VGIDLCKTTLKTGTAVVHGSSAPGAPKGRDELARADAKDKEVFLDTLPCFLDTRFSFKTHSSAS
jgi:hypothetical protein